MQSKTSMLHVRMNREVKDRAMTALAATGLTASEAVSLLFHRIIVDQAFPLELKVPNTETRATIAEPQDFIASREQHLSNGTD
jgi:DNA-damage-inducible protein J